MCDSISIIAWIDDDLTDEEYDQCQFPERDLDDTDQQSSDFRMQYPKSPLTGAGFKITPLGMLIPGTVDKRYFHGRIAGYLVEVNPPACVIGHNRMLVNGVPAAARVSVWLLLYWLARNGCTAAGLDKISFDNVDIVDLTLTFLYLFGSEREAREFLYEFRRHSETLLNKKQNVGDNSKKIAYSIPPDPVGPESEHHYTSYVRMRQFKLKAYVKGLNQLNAVMLPIADKVLETEMQEETIRTFRPEVQVHGKWLKDMRLNKISGWEGKTEPYELVFGLLRTTLELDKKVRAKRMKVTTVDVLPLCARDKKLLAYHLRGGVVREHEHFRNMDPKKASQYYSAVKIRVRDQEGIDFDVPYVDTKVLSPKLSALLVRQEEFKPDYFKPGDHFGGYVFSRVSEPVVLKKLDEIVADVLENGPDSVPPLPRQTIYNGPNKPNRNRGISDAPVPPEYKED